MNDVPADAASTPSAAPEAAGGPEAAGIPEAARLLGLTPHPEGGWYRRTWAGTHEVATPTGTRPAATLIHYYLDPGDASAWHVVASDEIWLWHGPGTAVLELGGAGAAPQTESAHRLGGDLAAGERPQLIVPAGVWQRALPQQGRGVLVSCVVSPGFSFDDWQLAE